MTLSAKIYGRCGRRPLDPDLRPRPRAELRDLKPLDRVLAQLDAMRLEYRKTYSGYAGRCPNHLGEPGRLNFEVVELDRDREARNGSVRPDREAMALDELHSYYRGAFAPTTALEGRVTGFLLQRASREISRHRQLIRDYAAAAQQTADLARDQS